MELGPPAGWTVDNPMPTQDLEAAALEVALLRQAVEALEVGVTITGIDGRILFTNRTDAEMHGYAPAELVGQDVGVLGPEGSRQPLGRDQLDRLDRWRRRTHNRRRDGSLFPVELVSEPTRDEAGAPLGIVTSCRDLTEVERTETELHFSRQGYELAASGIRDGLWDLDAVSGFVTYSARLRSLLGCRGEPRGEQLEGLFERIHVADRERVRRAVQSYLSRQAPRFEAELRVHHTDGSYRWMRAQGIAAWVGEQAHRMVGSLTDVTELKVVDPLTGLRNRSSLMDLLAHAIDRAQRKPPPALALLFLDIDRFKVVNDSLGHLIGDQLLAQLSHRLLTCLRASDTLARYGGDEFAIVIEDIASEADAMVVAERIYQKLGRPIEVEGRSLHVTVSIGVVFHRGGVAQPEDLLRDADLAMYRAKALGRGRLEVFEERLRHEAEALLEIETDLRSAVAAGEGFRPVYQPIYDLELGSITGFEALMRWQHPRRGQLDPAQFLQVAEETGLIVPLGMQVIEEACRQMKEWHDQEPGAAGLDLAVNLSARQLVEPELAQDLLEVVRRSGLDPRRLVLDIAETTILSLTEEVVARVVKLRDHGVRIHLDDFGAGYSSLRYLLHYPLDGLKIAGSFVHQLGPEGKGIELVRALIGLGVGRSISVVAEGIEEAGQVTTLRDLGCRLGQGYRLSEPVDRAAATALIRGGVTPDSDGSTGGQEPP